MNLQRRDVPRIYLTLRCPLACDYCTNGRYAGGYEELGADDWLHRLEQLPGGSVVLTGGEPTTHAAWVDIVNRCSKRVSIYSSLSAPLDPSALHRRVAWRASCHARDRSQAQEFIGQYRRLVAQGHPVRCFAVRPPDEVLEEFGSEGIPISIDRFQDWPRVGDPRPSRLPCYFDRILIAPDGDRYHCASALVRRDPAGLVDLHDGPTMICRAPNACYPCDIPVRSEVPAVGPVSLDSEDIEAFVRAGVARIPGLAARLESVGGQLLQNEAELAFAVTLVRLLRPETVVEIGVASGGTLWAFGSVCAPSATIVYIDPSPNASCDEIAACLLRSGYRPVRVPQSSQRAIATVTSALGGRKIDLLHIDGDHSYEGCMRDWELYSPLVASGGVVLLHDADNPACAGAVKAWREIAQKYRYSLLVSIESPLLVSDEVRGIGYGVVRME